MKKLMILVLLLFIGFQNGNMKTNANSSNCYKSSCSTVLKGTSFDNNILSKTYKEDVKAIFSNLKIDSGTIQVEVNMKNNKEKLNFDLLGNVYYDSSNELIYFDLLSDNKDVTVKSFYIRIDVDSRLLNERNKELDGENILFIAFEVYGEVYYFEESTNGIFDFVIKDIENLKDFNEYKSINPDIVAKFGAMMQWFMYYPRIEKSNNIEVNPDVNPEENLIVVNSVEPGGGGGSIPSRDQYVPDYLYSKYYIFTSSGEGMYYSGDYFFYKVTYPNYMGYSDAFITYTIEMELINILPGDYRYEWNGQVGLQINVLQQRHYVYFESQNEITTFMNYESFRIKNAEFNFRVLEDDLAWRTSVFFGSADKHWYNTNDIKVGFGLVPVVGQYIAALWDIVDKDLASNMSNSYTKTYDSYLSDQISKNKIATEIVGEANKYWLQEPGHFLQLSGYLTLKESSSVTGYKDTVLKYSFDVYTYNGFGIWSTHLYSNNTSKYITYYR